IGTSLLSALVSSGSITFDAAVECATKIGSRWDDSLRANSSTRTEDEIDWSEFQQVRQLMEGHSTISLNVEPADLPIPKAPGRPFWYSATVISQPMLITTAEDAANALATMNLASWSYAPLKVAPEARKSIRGWLISPLHPMARLSRWSLSNYLLATPAS